MSLVAGDASFANGINIIDYLCLTLVYLGMSLEMKDINYYSLVAVEVKATVVYKLLHTTASSRN